MKIDFKDNDAKELFLRYAVPCGHVLVSRGDLKKEKLEKIKKMLIQGKKINYNLEKIFPVGIRMCMLTAKRMKKRKIDESVIREYFWNEHKRAIAWRSKIYPDVGEECLIQRGTVLRSGKLAKVKIGNKKKLVKSEFVKVFPSDSVIVHYDYIVEKNIGKQS